MKRIILAALAVVCFSMGVAAGAIKPWKLSINGTTVSTSARVISGTTYVPIRDVAHALGLRASVVGTDITLKSKEIARPVVNPVEKPIEKPIAVSLTKLQGFSIEELYSQKWGFRVLDVQRARKFRSQYRNNINRQAEYSTSSVQELIVLRCRVKNATSTTQTFAFPLGLLGMNTALIDQDGIAYKPAGYDVIAEVDTPFGKNAVTGTAVPFNIIFRVPVGTRVKELVYSVVTYEELSMGKSTDFHVDFVSS